MQKQPISDLIAANLKEASEVLHAFYSDSTQIEAIATAANLMLEAIENGHKIIACGNGGSMCDAMHFAEELTGRFRENRQPIAALSISDPSHLSCVANDFGFDYVFSRYVEAIGQSGDVLLAISTSGNSQNVLLAANAALEKGMKVVALTGKDGGRLAQSCSVEIRAPKSDYADRAQEIHIKVIHSLIQAIELGLS